MSRFIFIYTPQILHHFHFISNPISTLLFVSFPFTKLLSFNWIFTIFPSREARLGPQIFVHLQSGQHPFQFGLEYIKTRLRRTTSYTSYFDVIFIFFLTPYLPCFCLVFRSILTTVIRGDSYGIFTNPSSSKDDSLHFTLETRPSVVTHFFHENPQNYCKVNSYPPLPGNNFGQLQ